MSKSNINDLIIEYKKELNDKVNLSKEKLFKKEVNEKISSLNSIIKTRTIPSRNSVSVLNFEYLKDQNKKSNRNTFLKQNKNPNQIIIEDSPCLQNDFESNLQQFPSNYYDKSKILQKRKNDSIEEMRLNYLKQELSNLKEKPDIDKKSKLISQKMSPQPIYNRINEVQEKKTRNISKIREALELSSLDRKIISKSFVKSTNIKDSINFYESVKQKSKFEAWNLNMIHWEEKRNKKIFNLNEKLKNMKYEEELEFRYKPKLNKSSSNIIGGFFERMEYLNNSKHEKIENIKRNSSFRFKPETNQKVPSYLRKANSKIFSKSNICFDYPVIKLLKERNNRNSKLHSKKHTHSGNHSLLKNKETETRSYVSKFQYDYDF